MRVDGPTSRRANRAKSAGGVRRAKVHPAPRVRVAPACGMGSPERMRREALEHMVERCTALSAEVSEREPELASYSGWLVKQGQVVRNWKRRFFMLADRRVRYYEDARLADSVLSGLNMRGELDIECWVLHPADPSRAEHEHIELLGWMGKPRHWREKGGAARSMLVRSDAETTSTAREPGPSVLQSWAAALRAHGLRELSIEERAEMQEVSMAAVEAGRRSLLV